MSNQSIYIIGYNDGCVKFGRSQDVTKRHYVIACREGRGRGKPHSVFVSMEVEASRAASVEKMMRSKLSGCAVSGYWELITADFDAVVEAFDEANRHYEARKAAGRRYRNVRDNVIRPLMIADLIASGEQERANRLRENWEAKE